MTIGETAKNILLTEWNRYGYGQYRNWFGRAMSRVRGVAVAPEIQPSAMIELSPTKRIMRGEVTIALFTRVMRPFSESDFYHFRGHNDYRLEHILANPKRAGTRAGRSVTYVSLEDAREFAKRLSEQTKETGWRYRVQTQEEYLQAKDQMSGKKNTWLETETGPGSGMYILCDPPGVESPFFVHDEPGHRWAIDSIRLVAERIAV